MQERREEKRKKEKRTSDRKKRQACRQTTSHHQKKQIESMYALNWIALSRIESVWIGDVRIVSIVYSFK